MASTHVTYRGPYLEGMTVEVDIEQRIATVTASDGTVQCVTMHPKADLATLTVKRVSKPNMLKLKCNVLVYPIEVFSWHPHPPPQSHPQLRPRIAP